MREWEQRLTEDGYRLTAPRRAVINVLRQTTTPLSPTDVLQEAQKFHKRLGLVTVYRMLNLLEKLNLVRRIHVEGGCHGYVPASSGHYHAVICQNCHRAVEFPGYNDLDRLVSRVEAQTGYQVNEHLLQLFGVCRECQRRCGHSEKKTKTH